VSQSAKGSSSNSSDILILKQTCHRLSKRLVFIETFLKEKFRMLDFIFNMLAYILYGFLEVQTLNCFLVYSFSAFSTSELEFVKPNVTFFHGQDQDHPPEVPSSSSLSPSPQRRTRARTAHENSPSKEVRQKEKEEQKSLLSVKVESVESENEEDGDSAAAGQLTIDETSSLPEDFHFFIEDPEEKVEPVDDGLLPVNCTA
jgi:hypothetical protein